MIGYLLLILLVFLVAATTAWKCWRNGGCFCRSLPRRFRERQSQEETWKQACPDETIHKADALLWMLCEAFSFNSDDRYRFAPNDRIMDVYRACYPRWQFWKIADCMEIESLMMGLQQRFQLNDAEMPAMTLVEIANLLKIPALAEQSPEIGRQ